MSTQKSELNVIQGKRIVQAVLDVGDAGVELDDGTKIAIYNSFEIQGGRSISALDLQGRIVTEVKESQSSIEIILDGGITVTIDMRDEAFTGPEALQLIVPGRPIAVWN